MDGGGPPIVGGLSRRVRQFVESLIAWSRIRNPPGRNRMELKVRESVRVP